MRFSLLGISDDFANLSLAGQLASMFVAVVIARGLVKSRGIIWLVAFLGCFGAMVAHILVDGQGAFLLLVYTPLVYLFSVVGRRDLK